MGIAERLSAFRGQMKKDSIDVVVVPTADSHASEYIADHFKTRQWLCGFTGSAGTLVVASGEAALFADGRYFIQAEHQLQGSGVTLMRMGTQGTPTLEEYVLSLAKAGQTVGIDFSLVSGTQVDELGQKLSAQGAQLVDTGDWFDVLWEDRPAMPDAKAFALEERYAGRSVSSKLEGIREVMRAQNTAAHVCNVLDDIAWTLNVRGGDVLDMPVVMSYLIVTLEDAEWFVDEDKVDAELRAALEAAGVTVRPYGGI